MKKIMIVDDSFTSRLYIKKCIAMVLGEEMEVTEAKNGEDALKKLREGTVELIISDVNMPVMCGFTLLRNLKETAQYKDIPVIFITSLANDGRSENLKELGAFDVLKKPLTPALLMDAVKELTPQKEQDSASAWGS